MVAFQKRWPVMKGKINMICKEWLMEIDQIFRLKWDFLGLSRGFPLCIFIFPLQNLARKELRARMSNYIPFKTMDVIDYPCHYPIYNLLPSAELHMEAMKLIIFETGLSNWIHIKYKILYLLTLLLLKLEYCGKRNKMLAFRPILNLEKLNQPRYTPSQWNQCAKQSPILYSSLAELFMTKWTAVLSATSAWIFWEI